MGQYGAENGYQTFSVHTEEPIIVTPAVPTSRSAIFLHNIDQQVFFHVEMLFMYDTAAVGFSPDDTADVVDRVRNALRESLVPYYFAAGRYKVNEAESRLEIDCNDQGAWFAGAVCDARLSDHGDLSIPNPDFRKLLLYPRDVNNIEQLPLFTVQVTRFKCGGFVVGFNASHAILDGISGSQFNNDIARIARGLPPSSVIPTPDRTCLRSRAPPKVSFGHRELISLPDIPAKLLFNPAAYDPSQPPRYTFKTFTFTAKDLGLLKNKALKDGSLERCTTFEALTAHVWQARTRALGADPGTISKLFIVVNIRDKIKSVPLSVNFIGNGVIAAPCVDTTVETICRNSLSECVKLVQRTIGMVDEEYVRSEIDWCEMNGHGIIDLPGGMIISSWSKLAFNDVDFGWGKPEYIAPVVNDRGEYVLVLSSCKEDGGVHVFMGMESDGKMAKLEKHMQIEN